MLWQTVVFNSADNNHLEMKPNGMFDCLSFLLYLQNHVNDITANQTQDARVSDFVSIFET